MRRIKFIEVNSEIGARRYGASLGAGAIRTAAFNAYSDIFKRNSFQQVKSENHLLYSEGEEAAHARYIHGMLPLYKRMSEAVCQAATDGYFPLVLSGDHATAGATIAGLKMANRTKRLGVVWIDAHADSHSPYTSPSGRMHGMPLCTALGEDNMACRCNEPDEATKRLWEGVKMTGGFSPKVEPQDVVYVALRSYEKEEADLINRLAMKVVEVDELRRQGAAHIAKHVLDYLGACDSIYISFDIDSLDSSIAKGTGTSEPDGLWENEASELIASLVSHGNVSCLEVSEVNPTLDDENKTAEIAFRIIDRSIKCIEDKPKD